MLRKAHLPPVEAGDIVQGHFYPGISLAVQRWEIPPSFKKVDIPPGVKILARECQLA
jgi:hypothetical protein